MRALLTILICFALNLRAADWYLDIGVTGSSSNAGTSEANAWTNVASIAWSSIGNNDTLWVDSGAYDSSLVVNGKKFLTIKAYPDAVAPAMFNDLHLYNADDLLIDGLVGTNRFIMATNFTAGLTSAIQVRLITNAVLRGIHVDRSANLNSDALAHHGIRIWDQSGNITIDNCLIENVEWDGINITQPVYTGMEAGTYDWFLVTNTIIRNVGDDGIQAAANAVKVIHSTIDKADFSTSSGAHPDGYQMNPDYGNIWIEGNYFRNWDQGVFIEYATNDVRVINNVFVSNRTDTGNKGLVPAARNSFTGKFVVANNTFFGFVVSGAINGNMTTNDVSKTVFGNNLFVNCRFIMLQDVSEQFAGTNNIYWDLPGVQFYNSGNPVPPPSNRLAGGSVFVDPELIDPANGNFRLASGSPAVGTGTDFSEWFTGDYTGATRTTWDMGAYAFDGETPPAPPPATGRGRLLPGMLLFP